MNGKEQTAKYYQTSFDLLIKANAMLHVNQITQARILSILRETDIEDEKKKISKLTQIFEDSLRSDIFDNE